MKVNKRLRSLCLTPLLLSCQLSAHVAGHNSNNVQHLHTASQADTRFPSPVRQMSPLQHQQLLHNSSTSAVHSKTQLHLAPDITLQNTAGCNNVSQLRDLDGSALIAAIESASLTGCLYGLYNSAFAGSAYFTDAKLQLIASSINQRLSGFNGTDASGAAELEKLVSYLRAAHWAESTSGRQFTASYLATLQQAFDQYFAGSHFVTFSGNSSRNFMLRYEMLVLVGSSGTDRLRYLARFSEAIKGYAATVSRGNNWGVTYEENGMTQLLTHYFNAVSSGSAAVKQLLLQQPQIISNLRDFVQADGLWLIGHTREYQWSDAVTELARMLSLGGAIADSVRPAVQQILSQYQFNGTGSKGWINAQGMVVYYDSANCHLYGDACSFDLASAILAGQHTCSTTLKIRYQLPVASHNLQQICQDLTATEQHFHQTFGTTTGQPVANDNNTDLEIVIFSSSSDYQSYAGTLFNISTDNGGMYLEGTPSDPQNQARFIAYQATWLQPDFVVWNLDHEYIHYLDGRFNQWGSFSDQPANLVWWGEGLAEYLAQGDDNASALAVAAQKTYQLSELFQTTYNNGDTARIYYWGYLATRFMFERQRNLVDSQLLPSLRAAKYPISDAACAFAWGWQAKPDAIAHNWSWLYDDSEWGSGNWVWTCGQPQSDNEPALPDYEPYAGIITDWGSRFDTEFHSWLDCIITAQDCSISQPEPLPLLLNNQAIMLSGDRNSEQHFTIQLPANAGNLRIATSGGSGDADLYVRQHAQASLNEWDARPYRNGNNEVVEFARPATEVYVMLHGYRAYQNVQLVASWQDIPHIILDEWSGQSSNSTSYYWVYVPANATALHFSLSGGSGDAQLYVKQQGWPTTSSYDAASATPGTTAQHIHMTSIVPGSYYHIMLNSAAGFSNVTLQAGMTE